MSTTEAVKAIYVASYFREPTDIELSSALDKFERNISTTALLAANSLSSDAAKTFSKLSKLHLLFFNQEPNYSEMIVWGNILRSGLPVDQVQNYFLHSERFADRVEAAESVATLLQEMVASVSGLELSIDLAEEYERQLTSGEISADQIVNKIISMPSSDSFVSNLLVTRALVDISQVTLTLSTESSLELMMSDVMAQHATATSIESSEAESSDTGGVTDKEGSADTDIIEADAIGSNIRAYGGVDVITLDEGVDTLIFESTAANNGEDSILNFSIGDGGDKLDFTLFLNRVSVASALTVVDSNSTSEVAWASGHILTLSGNGLSETTLASKFGVGAAFSAPSAAGKAVLLTADIVGNTNIFYLTNQNDTSNITADEIELVGSLVGVNNLQLVGFSADNFV